MEGSFNVQFFDLMVYIMPGAGALFCLGVLWSPSGTLSRVSSAKHPLPLVLAGFVAAFMLGFIVHTSMGVAQGAIDRLVGTRSLERFLRATPETDIARAETAACLALPFPNEMSFYRYAETVVTQHLPSRAASSSRLGALALFSRNLIPVAFLGALAVMRLLHQKRRRLKAGLIGVLLGLVVVLWHGYNVYNKNAISITLRGFSTWCRGQSAAVNLKSPANQATAAGQKAQLALSPSGRGVVRR